MTITITIYITITVTITITITITIAITIAITITVTGDSSAILLEHLSEKRRILSKGPFPERDRLYV